MTKNNDIILEMREISKSYPGVKALDQVSLSLRKGEVHALVGENGAGKSTLIKCISGAISPDSGKIILEGKELTAVSPLDTIEHGIETVYQELNLVSSLSVSENVFLGVKREGDRLYNAKENEKCCKAILDDLGIDIDPAIPVRELGNAKRQLVEIVRAISRNVKILILDEPTSSLTVHETQFLFDTIRRLRKEGVTIIYISHIFDETFALADRITVMRDGRYITTKNTEETSREELIKLMVGRSITESFKRSAVYSDEVVMEVDHLTGNGVSDISFQLRKGEILGFAGLVGAGRTELMQVVYGAAKKKSGDVLIDGKKGKVNTPHAAIKAGMGFIPEDRKLEGVFLGDTIEHNISISNIKSYCKFGVVNNKATKKKAEEFREKLQIKTPGINQLVKNLSGGNQQKVVIAKALAQEARIIIFDEPTRGIDVGAKQEIYKLMDQLVRQGNSIIMISSEMTELMAMSDRIVVLADGKKAAELQKEEYSQEQILSLASGE